MNRNTRTAVVIGVALVVATLATFAVYRVVQTRPVREVEVASTPTVVASRALPVGTRLTKDDIRVVGWPAKALVPGSFTSAEQVLNRGVMASIAENEPLTIAKVASSEAGSGLPPTIPPGMRAISVRVNEVIGVAGFVVPGTRVDVMVILRQGNDSLSRVVVSNVQVLTAGTRYDQQMANEGKAVPSSVVTLLVTPQDAERIGLAASDGQIMLTLRNPTDVTSTESAGSRTASLTGAQPPVAQPSAPRAARTPAPRPAPAPVPVAAAPAAPKPYMVETIRAAKRSEEALKAEETAKQ